jgi:hypothetical protein
MSSRAAFSSAWARGPLDTLAGEPLRQAGGERHDRERRVGASLGRHDAAVADEQVGDLPDAVVGVDHDSYRNTECANVQSCR